MNDVLGQLAEANPVEADELAPLGFPTLVRRPPARRIALAIAVVATAIAATLVGVFAFGRSPAGPPATGVMGPTGATGPQMLRHPIGAANEVTLAEAASAIGQPVVLPDTSLVGPADVGHVWAFGHGANGIVAVTYPAQSVIIEERPWPYSDPANAYAKVTQEVPGSTVIEVGETQVLAIPQNPDEQEFGHIVFDISGLRIEVYGPYDQATLRAIAQSIVDQTQTSGGTNVVPCCAMTTRISLRHASALLGGPVPLPSHSLLTTARAGRRVVRSRSHCWDNRAPSSTREVRHSGGRPRARRCSR